MRVLILGGTTEARRLAAALVGAPAADGAGSPGRAGLAERGSGAWTVITSLAGRTRSPLLPAGRVRIGGFGGADGLAGYLRDERIDVLVDATHPFAATMTGNAVAASRAVGVPLLVLRRPGWTAGPGDEWHRVASLSEAAALLSRLGDRVFLTTGRQGLAAFADVDDCWFLARSVEPPAAPAPRRLTVLLDRGPFTVDGERRLIREHQIGVLVTKDSGGSAAKLTAARELGVPVVMVDRPPTPDAPTASTVADAVTWLTARSG